MKILLTTHTRALGTLCGLVLLLVVSGCAGPRLAREPVNYYKEMFGQDARPAVEKVFKGASYIYACGDDLVLMNRGYYPENYVVYDLANHRFERFDDRYAPIAEFQKTGSAYDLPDIHLADLSADADCRRARGRGKPHYRLPFFDWTSRSGEVRTEFPPGTFWDGSAVYYRDYFVINFRSHGEGWRKAGIQVFDRRTGERLWQDIGRSYSTGWAFHDNRLFHVRRTNRGGYCECVDLDTGKKLWSLTHAPSEPWMQHEPELAGEQYDLPHIGGWVQSVWLPRHRLWGPRWLVAARDGRLVCLTPEGEVAWTKDLGRNLHFASPEARIAPLDPGWLNLKYLTAWRGTLFVIDAAGELTSVRIRDGETISAYAAPRPIIAPPVIRNSQAIIITETEIITVPIQEITGGRKSVP